jgi:hypothetical protein
MPRRRAPVKPAGPAPRQKEGAAVAGHRRPQGRREVGAEAYLAAGVQVTPTEAIQTSVL